MPVARFDWRLWPSANEHGYKGYEQPGAQVFKDDLAIHGHYRSPVSGAALMWCSGLSRADPDPVLRAEAAGVFLVLAFDLIEVLGAEAFGSVTTEVLMIGSRLPLSPSASADFAPAQALEKFITRKTLVKSPKGTFNSSACFE